MIDPDLPPEGVDFHVCEHGINVWFGHECGDCDEAPDIRTAYRETINSVDGELVARDVARLLEPAAVEHTFPSIDPDIDDDILDDYIRECARRFDIDHATRRERFIERYTPGTDTIYDLLPAMDDEILATLRRKYAIAFALLDGTITEATITHG